MFPQKLGIVQLCETQMVGLFHVRWDHTASAKSSLLMSGGGPTDLSNHWQNVLMLQCPTIEI